MKSHQLDLMTSVSTPTFDPSGSVVVFAASRPNFAIDSYTGQLWQVPVAGDEAPRRITSGKRDTAPQFSPDGKSIAFLRPDAKNRPQIAIVDARGGEARVITDRALGVNSFRWSGDSSRIAFTSATPEYGRYGTIDGVAAGAENPRRITEHKVRANGAGWVLDRRPALYVVEVPAFEEEPYQAPTGRVKDLIARAGQDEPQLPGEHPVGDSVPKALLLSDPRYAVSTPVWGLDDEHLYFSSAQHEGADDDLQSAIYRVALAAGVEFKVNEEREVEAPRAELIVGGGEKKLGLHAPAFSSDFSTLYVLGQELGETGYDFVARNTGVWAAPVASLPVGEPQLLTDIEHVDYGDVHSTLVTDGEGVLAFARVRGAGQLHRVTADGTVDIVSEGHRVITGAAVADGKIVVSYTDPTTPGEVAVVAGEDLRTLTNFAADLRERTTITKQIEFEATSKDGYPVHGWIFKPQGEGPHPVLLNIHGGPFADYQWAYFDEAQAYVAAGYAVVQCNPRGSAGYGRDHGVAIRQAMGTLDMDDVLSFFEQAVAANPELDGERAGVLGGSYGGYLTSWIIGHDHRFKGAIVERGFLEPFSFVGTSDIGWFFAGEYTGTDPEHVLTQSPMAVAKNVTTPTLVLHSEEDLRCPLEQAQQYYAALKRAGVDTEFLVFPGESHELSRTGTPWHRMQRFDAILEWWSRHLPVN